MSNKFTVKTSVGSLFASIEVTDFVPIVSLDVNQLDASSNYKYTYEGFEIRENIDGKTTTLSEFISPDKREQTLQGIDIESGEHIVRFTVEQANTLAKDDDGVITFKAEGVDVLTENEIEVEYGQAIALKISGDSIKEDAFIEFYAKDDSGLFDSEGKKNIFCGKIMVYALEIVCSCKKSKPAKNFVQLIELVKQSEENLMLNGYDDIGDRISIIRGLYYGTEWSLDYSIEKSKARNFAFNEYTNSNVKADAREALKCSENCKADLFNSLFNSYEVFDSRYKAIDFGHLIIGLDSRRSWRSKNIGIPTQGGTGLELNTWVGDLGGGVGQLSLDRVKNPNKRAKSLFPISGSSYGAMVNLEGDIASYVCGMAFNDEAKIVDPTDNFETIHDALQDYFDKKWNKRALFFLKMLDGEFEKNKLKNESDVIEYCAEAFKGFAHWYLGVRMKEKGLGGSKEFNSASGNFKPVSKEVASIFINGLLHVVEKPEDMISARTNPDPSPREDTTIDNATDFLNKLNPFD